MRIGAGMLALSAMAGMAVAEPVSGRDARRALFKGGNAAEMLPGSGLAADQQTVLQSVAVGQPYYGAIAISPAEGLMADATVAAANHHSVEAASRVALAECDAKRTGAVPCVLAALIRPEGWEPRMLQMSAEATAGFREGYPRRGGAMAVSPSTGAWGIAGGAQDAVNACAAKNNAAGDCTVLLVD